MVLHEARKHGPAPDQFEDIEHKMFGKDGFEDAEKKISHIEAELGFADLAQFTPPAPPKP